MKKNPIEQRMDGSALTRRMSLHGARTMSFSGSMRTAIPGEIRFFLILWPTVFIGTWFHIGIGSAIPGRRRV